MKKETNVKIDKRYILFRQLASIAGGLFCVVLVFLLFSASLTYVFNMIANNINSITNYPLSQYVINVTGFSVVIAIVFAVGYDFMRFILSKAQIYDKNKKSK